MFQIAGDRPMASGKPYRLEELLREINSLLPEPVRREDGLDGSTVLICGDPGEVVVRVTHEEILVSLYRVHWDGPHTPVVCPQELAKLRWDRLPSSSPWMSLHGLIVMACEMRRATFVECSHCKKVQPPEWMDGDVCQSCGERYFGIVH